MPKDGPVLLISDGQGHTSSCLLDEALTWKLGRSENNAIVIRDDAASRRHAIIQKADRGDLYLLDLGSSNGTFVNGERVNTPVILKDNDEITIGAYHLIFHTPKLAGGDESVMGAMGDADSTRVVFSERLVSVLVVDIRGFTRLTRQVDQSVLCKLVRRWFADAARIFREHGSWTLKFIGDAVMAVWLHQDGHELDDILSMFTAIFEFSKTTAALGSKSGFAIPVSFGAGINTGLASVGNAGSGTETDYTALGDAVNAAFRIEDCTRQIGCDVAIGDKTAEYLGETSLVQQYLSNHLLPLKGYEVAATIWAGSFEDVQKLLVSRAQQPGHRQTDTRTEFGTAEPHRTESASTDTLA